MKESEFKIKLAYITGLKSIVLNELNKENFVIETEGEDSFYLDFTRDSFEKVKQLRSVARAYLVETNEKYNPAYISKHKSILGDMIDCVTFDNERNFKSYKITCAGQDSSEVKSISSYIEEKYNLVLQEEADLKIHIIKIGVLWEVGIQITPRPLSVRDYRVVNMSGAMDPTIAYAVNSFCDLENANSYLNIFSGSGTLLIEAGQSYKNLKKIVGFDNNKKHLSLSIQNIKKAGLIDRVQIKEADIFDNPDFGKFDVIVSDLPFGMVISKDENLDNLYKNFIKYCEDKLNPSGKLVIYTSEYEIIENILLGSKFSIIHSMQLKFITSVNAYLRPKIIVCEFKTR